MKTGMCIAAVMTLVLGVTSAMASTAPAQKKLTYQEEGMTVTKTGYRFNSSQGYSMYVFLEYKASKQGPYDVFKLKTDPKVWFSVIKLKPTDSFAKLSIPVKRHLATIGQINSSDSHGTLILEAANFQKHLAEEYVYTRIHNQPFRFHIVHESDWESNAPFFAMFHSIQ